jgi:hypothetical protein
VETPRCLAASEGFRKRAAELTNHLVVVPARCPYGGSPRGQVESGVRDGASCMLTIVPDTAMMCLIEEATSTEQLHAISSALVLGVLVSNPRKYRQLENGKWVLQNRKVVPFSPSAG